MGIPPQLGGEQDIKTTVGFLLCIVGLAGIAVAQQLRVWVTDSQRGMQEGERVAVAGGKAEFQLDPMSFTTLIGAP
jgi:hypothetical protein